MLIVECAAYNIPELAFAIDFGDGSTNFWQSWVSAEQLDEGSPDEGTLCRLYTISSANQTGTYQKFALFSGTVVMGVEFALGWSESYSRSDTESLGDAVEAAMIKVFNGTATLGAINQNGVSYNGLITLNRTALHEGGPGSRQNLAFTLTFDLQTN